MSMYDNWYGSNGQLVDNVIDQEDFDPTTEEGIAECIRYLARDEGRVPCSRYGSWSSTCAPWAVAQLLIYIDANGMPDSPLTDFLDHSMGLVVNDHDDPLDLVLEHGHCLDGTDLDLLNEDAADLLREDIERQLIDASTAMLLAVRETLKETP